METSPGEETRAFPGQSSRPGRGMIMLALGSPSARAEQRCALGSFICVCTRDGWRVQGEVASQGRVLKEVHRRALDQEGSRKIGEESRAPEGSQAPGVAPPISAFYTLPLPGFGEVPCALGPVGVAGALGPEVR